MATKQRSKRRARPQQAAPTSPERRGPGLGVVGAGIAGLAALAAVVLAVLFSLGVVGGDDSSTKAEQKLKAGQPVTTDDVAGAVQGAWKTTFAKEQKPWKPATMAGGPTGDDPCQAPVAVYCDQNGTIYLEPKFMDRVRARAGTSTQLAEAFVVAHLLGHHVQRELGITEKVEKGEKLHPGKAMKIGKARDLEADCLAGYGLRGLVDAGVISTQGIERAMTAAAEAGQSLATPDASDFNQETWHSTALANRVKWFERGLRVPDVGACDTFGPLV